MTLHSCEDCKDMDDAARKWCGEYSFKALEEKEKKKKEPIENLNIDKAITVFSNKRDMAEQFIKRQPVYYDEAKLWWFWNSKEFCWNLIDDVRLLNAVSRHCHANTINAKEKNEILEALKQVGRQNKPKEAKKTWVQFKDTIVDIETGEKFASTSEYFVTNPIPWSLGKSEDTPIMDKIICEWVMPENKQMLYEIISYCILADYPIHRLFCLIGEGLNGKSKFLELINKFVGKTNCTSTELDRILENRFEVTKLHKKLVCVMGETNFAEMTKTSVLKKLTGQDLIGYEYKNKNLFDGINYAKILIATNNLPATTDKTIGFYRRWLIVDFPNNFQEQKNIIDTIPEVEFNNFALKSIRILKGLLVKLNFTNEGTVADRQQRYEDKSNPIDKFLKDVTEEDPDGRIFKYEFKDRLDDWCKDNRFRQISERALGIIMKSKGIHTGKVEFYTVNNEKKRYNAWLGLKWREIPVQDVQLVTGSSLHSHIEK